jgi:lipid-A-disaccharide synthase
MKKTIFIMTGEPSGDYHGATLARELQRVDPELRIIGAGGTRMREAGVEIIANTEHWGAIGIPEALMKLPKIYLAEKKLLRYLHKNCPDVIVTIDFGAFNVQFIKDLGDISSKKLYFLPPGSWSRNRKPGILPNLVDAIATQFPWSAENLRSANGRARIEWVGHPIIDYCKTSITADEARNNMNVGDRKVLLLAPGSRSAEFRHLTRAFMAAAQLVPNNPLILLALAPSLREKYAKMSKPANLDIKVLDGFDYNYAQIADAAIACSGTVTLELACLNVPMAVAYRGSWASWVQYKIVASTIKYMALPNIIDDSSLVPEYIQLAASPENLATTAIELINPTPTRQAQLDGFTRIRSSMGEGGAIEKTALMVFDLLK